MCSIDLLALLSALVKNGGTVVACFRRDAERGNRDSQKADFIELSSDKQILQGCSCISTSVLMRTKLARTPLPVLVPILAIYTLLHDGPLPSHTAGSGYRSSLRLTPSSSRRSFSSSRYSSYWPLFSTFALIPISSMLISGLSRRFRGVWRNAVYLRRFGLQ